MINFDRENDGEVTVKVPIEAFKGPDYQIYFNLYDVQKAMEMAGDGTLCKVNVLSTINAIISEERET